MKKRVENTGYEVHIKFNGVDIDLNDALEAVAESKGAIDVNGTYADFGPDVIAAQSFTDEVNNIEGYSADLMLIVAYDKPDFAGDFIKLFKIA